VIIFDEAQMLPIQYLKPCVRVITELVKNYGVSAVLCTATQPALNGIIDEYLPNQNIIELCPQNLFEKKVFSRVTYKSIGTFSEEGIASLIEGHDQVLCIVNSRKAAKNIYGMLHGEGCFHLSTSMYPLHRKKTISEIKERLQNGLPCRVVSTSLIEAGVDIDFPVVYRQICGLDSMLQAGGRCNREGRRKKEDSVVNVFELEYGSPELFSLQIAACIDVMKKRAEYTDKDAIQEYFDELINLKGHDALDPKGILDKLKKYQFASISDEFNLIDTNTRTLYIQSKENEREIDALLQGYAGRKEYQKLSLYRINIYEYQFRELEEKCAIRVLSNGECVLSDFSFYSPETGLDTGKETGQALFI